jgi:hypothetical protein
MSFGDLPVSARMAVLAGLALVAYLPALNLPLLSDDHTQLWLAHRYGPVSSWGELAADPLYRCRATSIWLTYVTERLLGSSAPVLHASSLLLHVLNTWLVFALGAWRLIGWRVSAVAAAFFAVYEGHQEAVMWYAALPELLVFFFGLAALAAWIVWLESGQTRRGWYLAAVALFAGALLSKESAVAFVPLMVIAAWAAGLGRRRSAAVLSPFLVLAAVYVGLNFAGRSLNHHYWDGTFSLKAPFWFTLPNSGLRLLWIWGVVAVACLLIWRRREWARLGLLAGCWIVVTLLPYSFLTYMTRVPSRHRYLASVGLAWLVAAAFLALGERLRHRRRAALALVASAVVAHNCLYLWTKKRDQFLRRAEPVQALLDFSRRAEGAIHIRCFPYGETVARHAIEVGAGKPASLVVWDPSGQKGGDAFCFPTHP